MLSRSKEFEESILSCGACHGRGCQRCQGIGIALWAGGRLFFWGQEMTALSIFLFKAQKKLRLAFNFLLGAIGIIGVLGLLYEVFLSGAARGGLLVFYFSLLTDAYLVQRL